VRAQGDEALLLDPPAAAQDLSVNLAAGHYVLMCNAPGHYKQGMYLDFTVQ